MVTHTSQFPNPIFGGLYQVADGGIYAVDRTVSHCMRLLQSRYQEDLAWNNEIEAVQKYHRNPQLIKEHPEKFPGFNAMVWKLIKPDSVAFRYKNSIEKIPSEQVEKDKNAVTVAKKIEAAVLGILTAPVLLVCGLVGAPLRAALVQIMNELVIKPTQMPHKRYEGEFSILTQNVAMTEFEIMNCKNDMRPSLERSDELISYLLTHLIDHDIFFLQEAFTPHINKRIAKTLNKFGYSVVFQVKPDTIGMSSGLLIASRYEILAADFVPYTHTAGPDAYAKKGVLMMKIKLRNGECAFIANTHMLASADLPKGASQHYPDQYFNWEHRMQFKTVNHSMEEFIKKNRGNDKILFTLFGGDFNIRRMANLFGNPAVYANSISYEPLEKLLDSPGEYHELTESGKRSDNSEEGNEGTGLGKESGSYRFVIERFHQKLLENFSEKLKSFPTVQKLIDEKLNLFHYNIVDWEEAQEQLQKEGASSKIAQQIIQEFMQIVATFDQTIYRQAGKIDHILYRKESEKEFYDTFKVKRSSGVMIGKGGVISDHAYVSIRMEQKR